MSKTPVYPVRRDCRFFNDPEVCRKLKSDQNCYGCIITELDSARQTVLQLHKKNDQLEKENKALKLLLGEQTLQEYFQEQKDYDEAHHPYTEKRGE